MINACAHAVLVGFCHPLVPFCVAVLEQLKREHVQPVTRTYNTLMIACNTSNQWQVREMPGCFHAWQGPAKSCSCTPVSMLRSLHGWHADAARPSSCCRQGWAPPGWQPASPCPRARHVPACSFPHASPAQPDVAAPPALVQEALRVYEEMVASGHQPNTTTYNALISGELQSCGPRGGCFTARLDAVRLSCVKVITSWHTVCPSARGLRMWTSSPRVAPKGA